MPETLFTVWTNLFERAYATEGDTVLVHGGTSGIGTMAIALCKLFGLTIIVTAGSDEKCARALELGAASRDQLQDRGFRRAGEGDHRRARASPAVLDMVGGDYVPRNLQCLADDGRHVSIAVQGGRDGDDPDLRDHAPPPDADRIDAAPARRRRSRRWSPTNSRRTVWPHVEAGQLKPVIDRTFPLAEAADAHRADGSGRPCRQDRADGRRVSRHWLLALSAVAFAAVFLKSPLPWSLTNTPGFDRIAAVPAAAQKPMRIWLDERGVKLPWPGLPEAEQPLLTLGYAHREVVALKAPFAAYGDPGLVLYDGRGKWGPPVPLDDEAATELRRLSGRALDADYSFPLWRYLWGWLLFVPLALWFWLQRRAEQRRADAAGIM